MHTDFDFDCCHQGTALRIRWEYVQARKREGRGVDGVRDEVNNMGVS